jgi:hypothetical protein
MQNNNFNNVALIYLACPSKRNLMFFLFLPHKQHNFMFFSFFGHKVEDKVHVHDIFPIISYKPFLLFIIWI